MDKVSLFGSRGAFFKVLSSTGNSQIAVMTIQPGRDSGGEESHPGDQVVVVLEGTAKIHVGNEVIVAAAGDAAIIPAHTVHRIVNHSEADVFLVSVYAPPAY